MSDISTLTVKEKTKCNKAGKTHLCCSSGMLPLVAVTTTDDLFTVYMVLDLEN